MKRVELINLWTYNAWEYALSQYDCFAHDSYPSYYVEETKTSNCQLRKMLKAVLDELLAHGVDIHDYELPVESRRNPFTILLRNLEEGRELFEDFYGLNPEELKPNTYMYRGKERTVPPMLVEERRQRYEIKWRELEPVLRAYCENTL